ncbi:MAG: FecR family protein [Spirochaetales bacterium]|nr:FecR family protein [Spirochaetales bacterium]
MKPSRSAPLLLWLAFFFSLSSAVSAQSDTYAFVIYAEGFDLSIFRNGELSTYDVLVDDVLGMPLLAGDLVQTGGDTFVEIQVMPSRTIVKVAENTTFEIESLGGAGGGTFNMNYGRLRARVERITTNETFEIRGFTAVAGVRGTDFGYDMVVEREATNELQTRVYVFDGEVEVSENVAAEADVDGAEQVATPQTVRLTADEMVSVVTEVPASLATDAVRPALPDEPLDERAEPDGAPPRPVVFQPESLQEEIEQFWDERDFQREAVEPDEVEAVFPGINARVEELTQERLQYEELQRLRREGLLHSSDEADVRNAEEIIAREPDPVELQQPLPEDRIRTLISPGAELGPAAQWRVAGHWFMGVGLALEIAGLATAWHSDDVRSTGDLSDGGPGAGLMIGGGIFIGSGLISYLLSAVTAD